MTDYMFRQFMYRMKYRKTQRQVERWMTNVKAAADRWSQDMQSVPLDAWRTAMAMKGVSSLG